MPLPTRGASRLCGLYKVSDVDLVHLVQLREEWVEVDLYGKSQALGSKTEASTHEPVRRCL